MIILVPVKRVVDPYAKVRPLADGSGLDLAGIKHDINPFDEIAVEEAVRQKERDPGIEIVCVSVGPQECEEQLRKALAMGCDRAIHIVTEDKLDSTVVAAELHAVVQAEGADLVLMGKQATDDDNNQAAQMLAATLDWPQATFACRVEIAQGSVTVARETDTGEETLQLPLPCVVTADLRLNEPRYIALPGIIKARSKPLEARARSTAAVPKTKVVSLVPSPARGAGKRVASVDELITALKEKGVLA